MRSSLRELTSSFTKTLCRWYSTVRGLRKSCAADLGVRVAVAGQPGDLRLLCGELVARLGGTPAQGLAGRQQLAAGALGERLGPHPAERLVRGAELVARIHAAVLAAQPLAVAELRAGEVDCAAGAAEPLDGLLVQGLGGAAVAQLRTRACLDPERPVGADRARPLAEPIERVCGHIRCVGTRACLDELDERPGVHADVVVLAPLLRRDERLGVTAEAVVQQRAAPS